MKEELIKTAKGLSALGKGIGAFDESTGTIGKRFESIKVENTHPHRQAYREILFTTPEIEKYISGIILFDETVRDSFKNGKNMLITYALVESMPVSKLIVVSLIFQELTEKLPPGGLMDLKRDVQNTMLWDAVLLNGEQFLKLIMVVLLI